MTRAAKKEYIHECSKSSFSSSHSATHEEEGFSVGNVLDELDLPEDDLLSPKKKEEVIPKEKRKRKKVSECSVVIDNEGKKKKQVETTVLQKPRAKVLENGTAKKRTRAVKSKKKGEVDVIELSSTVHPEENMESRKISHEEEEDDMPEVSFLQTKKQKMKQVEMEPVVADSPEAAQELEIKTAEETPVDLVSDVLSSANVELPKPKGRKKAAPKVKNKEVELPSRSLRNRGKLEQVQVAQALPEKKTRGRKKVEPVLEEQEVEIPDQVTANDLQEEVIDTKEVKEKPAPSKRKAAAKPVEGVVKKKTRAALKAEQDAEVLVEEVLPVESPKKKGKAGKKAKVLPEAALEAELNQPQEVIVAEIDQVAEEVETLKVAKDPEISNNEPKSPPVLEEHDAKEPPLNDIMASQLELPVNTFEERTPNLKEPQAQVHEINTKETD